MNPLQGLVSSIYRLIERCLPVSNTQCFISYPDVQDSALTVYVGLLQRDVSKLGELVWLVKDVSAARCRLENAIGRLAAGAKIIRKNSVLGVLCFASARRVFFTHGHYWFVRAIPNRAKLINLWHGMPLKAIGLLDGKQASEVQATEITIASSEYFRPIMAGAFGVSENRVLVTGLPRCDSLLSPSAKARKERSELVVGDRPLVVWMPTYLHSVVGDVRADSSADKDCVLERFRSTLKILSEFATQKAIVVVVKLHPMDFLNAYEFSGNEGVIVLNSHDDIFSRIGVYDLLSVSDGLITDASSVVFDYMVTSRPILLTTEFFDEYRRGLTFDLSLLMHFVFHAPSVGGAAQFFDAVSTRATVPRKAPLIFCAYEDCGATARVIQALEEVDKESHRIGL